MKSFILNGKNLHGKTLEQKSLKIRYTVLYYVQSIFKTEKLQKKNNFERIPQFFPFFKNKFNIHTWVTPKKYVWGYILKEIKEVR